MKKLWLGLLAALMLLGAARAEVEMTAVNVGWGDAIVLRAGDYCCLIDTGSKDAEQNLSAALESMGIARLDALFITHTDGDHVGGLKWLRKSEIEIDAIYASRCYPELGDKKHPAVKTAEKLDLSVNWLGAGDLVPLGDSGAVFSVLAPETEIPGSENDNSLVMMLESPDGRILLAGDMEYLEEAVLLGSGAKLDCDVLKVPNHADDDACSPSLVAACAPETAVISANSEEKSDTPSQKVLTSLAFAHCDVYITQNCTLGVRVTLDGGQVSAQYLNW